MRIAQSRLSLLVLIGASALSLPVSSQAAYSNYNSVLIGERAAGLGGAFTALTGDPAATPYYNPATTVLLEGSSLSASVNVYNKYDTHIGGSQEMTDAPQKVNRGFFRSIPASSGTVVNFGSFAIGMSILVPDYDFYSGPVKGTDGTTSFLNFVDESLWAGATFSARLTEQDAVGISLYYTARNLARSNSDRVVTSTSALITEEEKNLTANALVAIIGYHRRLSPTWSIGASYRVPSLPIAGDASYYRSRVNTSPFSTETINQANQRAITRIPAKFSLGVAREIKGQNTLSLDVQLYESVSYNDLPESPQGAEHITHQPIANLAIGYEQAVREWATLRLGYFTNLSSHPTPDNSSTVRQGDHVDMYGFSANMAFRTRDNTKFTFGGYYSGGSGLTTQLTGDQLRVLSKSQQIFTMLVATGFFF
jgi:long-chain fatty acid transport protein